MPKDVINDSELIEEIKKCWKPLAYSAGRLVQRFDGVWHYAVALSDTSAVSWGPSKALNLYHRGFLSVHNLGTGFKDVVQVSYLSTGEIFENLIASVPAFHYKWEYGIQGWNCEHWSRLVVSGEPISYQVKEQVFGIFDAFGVLSIREEAIEHLNSYKREHRTNGNSTQSP